MIIWMWALQKLCRIGNYLLISPVLFVKGMLRTFTRCPNVLRRNRVHSHTFYLMREPRNYRSWKQKCLQWYHLKTCLIVLLSLIRVIGSVVLTYNLSNWFVCSINHISRNWMHFYCVAMLSTWWRSRALEILDVTTSCICLYGKS